MSTLSSINSFYQALSSGLIKSNKDRVLACLHHLGPKTINEVVSEFEKISKDRVSDRSVSSALSTLHKEGKVVIEREVVQSNGYKASVYKAV